MLTSNGTERYKTSSYILLDHSNAFGLSKTNYFVPNKGKGDGFFHYEFQWHLCWTKLSHLQLDQCILQNKTIIRTLRHILKVFDILPLLGPMGPGLGQNCTCRTRPWAQQHDTIHFFFVNWVSTEFSYR